MMLGRPQDDADNPAPRCFFLFFVGGVLFCVAFRVFCFFKVWDVVSCCCDSFVMGLRCLFTSLLRCTRLFVKGFRMFGDNQARVKVLNLHVEL